MLWAVEDGKIKAHKSYAIRYNHLPDLDVYGIPEILDIEVETEALHTYISVEANAYTGNKTRVNFEIEPGEYVRTNYLCSTWLKYVVTTGNVGAFNVGGCRMSYAETLKYLNKLLDHMKEREEEEKELITAAGGEEWIKENPEWDRLLCEWRLANGIPALSARSAKKFLSEHNNS